MSKPARATEVDFAIIGAGVSGVGAARFLMNKFPNKSLVIFEGRESIGGTWDLFKYPGIRSDSDMFTFGYSFNPWIGGKVFADGPTILSYIKSTVEKFDIGKHIELSSRVVRASWSSSQQKWTLSVRRSDGSEHTCSARFLLSCTGYYNYTEPHKPNIKDQEQFKGTVIYPQLWPENFDYTDKDIVIVGSGATAITLVPSMADKAKHITMLQRSPTYISALPSVDPVAQTLKQFLPSSLAFFFTRWYHILFAGVFYYICRKFPMMMKDYIIGKVREGCSSYIDVDKHLVPKYNPWEQRFCMDPDGKIFKTLKSGKASIVTDEIVRFTDKGLLLKSGQELEADAIILATGLKIQLFGGMEVDVDGSPLTTDNSLLYKGMMLNEVPNLVQSIGYVNASWTIRSDGLFTHFCKIVEYMDKRGFKQCTPVYDANKDPNAKIVSFTESFSSGYFDRAGASDPKALSWVRSATRFPWLNNTWMFQDMWTLYMSSPNNDELHFK